MNDTFESIHKESIEVNIAQCGPNSKLKYTEISNLFQIVAAHHSHLGGMSFFDMQKNEQAWVSSRIRFEIEELPYWHKTIEMHTWIENLEGMRSIRNFEIFYKGKKMVGGTSLWVVLNTTKRRPENIAISHDHIGKYPEKRATEKMVDIVDINHQSSLVKTHQVEYSDLDIVNHVNNLKYLEWCLDCIDRELLDENRIKALELNFIKELQYQDKIEIERAILGNEHFFYIKKDQKVCFALKVEF